MASTVFRSAEEASSRSMTAALACVARSPLESTETRVLREAGDAMQRRESSSDGKVSAVRICPDTRCFTAGLCVYLGDNLVLWSSKR
jgi:hypothetical protein